MVYFHTSQEWLQQSSLLLKASPSTAKITTKYRIQKPTASKTRQRKQPEQAHQDGDASQTQPVAKALLTLKTWDPQSGVCLMYRTDKAAEVGRLIASLGRLGRDMAALPEVGDTAMLDAPPPEQGSRTHSPAPETVTKDPKVEAKAAQGAGGGGGGKKKKKGKK